MLQALVLVTVARGLTHILAPYILAIGRFRFSAQVKIVEVAFFLVGIFVGVHYLGLVGAALGAGLGYLVAAILRIGYVVYLRDVGLGEVLVSMLLTSVTAALGGLAAAAAAGALGEPSFLKLIPVGVVYVLAYAAAVFVLRRRTLNQVLAFARGRK